MRQLVSILNSWLLNRILEKVTAKECPDKLERLWEDRQKEDCYFTVFEIKEKPLAVLWGYSEHLVRVKFFSDNKYSDEKQLALNEIPPGSLQVNHYFHGNQIKFNGAYDWFMTSVFPWPYIRIWVHKAFGSFLQQRFNKKKIVTETRSAILRVVIEDYLDGRKLNYSALDLAGRLYSDRIYLRPDSDEQIGKLERILETLCESEYLRKNQLDYSPTGRGISVFEQHEEEDRRHRQVVWTQWLLVALTLAIAAAAIVQAGVIKIPLLLDLS
jgi:hypothetical protein